MAMFKCGDRICEAFRIGHDQEPGWFGRLVSLRDARPFDGGWELFMSDGVRDVAVVGDWIVTTPGGCTVGYTTDSLAIWPDDRFRAEFRPA